MPLLQEILAWSQHSGVPLWQRDALRRFLTSATFAAAEEEQVFILLKAEAGLIHGTVPAAVPLAEEHLPLEADEETVVQLGAIKNVVNVNRLSPDQDLSFGADGLTVVYGDNGSGKSGYVRLLKHACRERSVEPILPNVFAATDEVVPAATIRYRTGPDEEPIDGAWRHGESFAPALSQMAVFDSRVATVTVEQDNELRVLPRGLDALENLADLSRSLAERLKAERNACGSEEAALVQGLGAGGAVEAIIGQVAAETGDEAIAALVPFSVADGKRLADLRAMLRDPEARAKALRGRKQRCETALGHVKAGLAAVSDEVLRDLREKAETVASLDKAAEALSAKGFASEPLEGVGTPAWKYLFEAARDYSVEHAYVGRDFPATEMGDKCVLCHQELAPDAQARMQRFDAFVKAEVETKLKQATQAFTTAMTPVLKAADTLKAATQALEAVDDEDSAWRDHVKVLVEAGSARQQMVSPAVEAGDWTTIPALPAINVAALEQHGATLETEARACEAALEAERKAELHAEAAGLAAREVLSGKMDALKKLRDLRRRDKTLADADKLTRSNKITTLRKELDQRYIQDDLREKLSDEIKALKLERLPVALGFQTRSVKTRHKIALDGAVAKHDVNKVVSEGEHRALALAAFLAQVCHQSTSAGIIVDDPVSSLDHDRRDLVARRLVEEAARRQVIVFTHDLVFYHMLREQCEIQRVRLTSRSLEPGVEMFGIVSSQEPWLARDIKGRLHFLEYEELPRLRRAYDEDRAAYERSLLFFHDRLRRTWERLIEEVIFAKCVLRFDPGIRTQSLDSVAVEDEVVHAVHRGMTEASKWTGHDEAASVKRPVPTPDDLAKLIAEVRECRKQAKRDSEAAKERRTEDRKTAPAETF